MGIIHAYTANLLNFQEFYIICTEVKNLILNACSVHKILIQAVFRTENSISMTHAFHIFSIANKYIPWKRISSTILQVTTRDLPHHSRPDSHLKFLRKIFYLLFQELRSNILK